MNEQWKPSRPDTAFASAVIWDPLLTRYRFSSTHPMDPVRLDLTARLCADLGLLERIETRVITPKVATDEELSRIHRQDYIHAVMAGSERGRANEDFGLGTEDTPVFEGMHEAAARIADGSLALARGVTDGEFIRGLNFAGGMHHAQSAQAGGFCIYNDTALAIDHFLRSGYQRVLYIDVDAHHGDGTQEIFYSDPRVITISIHQSGVSLYPGSGFPHETGSSGAEGSAVNIALPAHTSDDGFLRAFHAVVPAIVQACGPEVIVSQHGCDSHRTDPLSALSLSVEGQRQLAADISYLSMDSSQGRWIATGGGGYSINDVVPRTWAHLCALVTGTPLSCATEIPAAFRDYARTHYELDTPTHMGDGAELWWRPWELGYDPDDEVDRAIMATRKEIFPSWGLDPWRD